VVGGSSLIPQKDCGEEERSECDYEGRSDEEEKEKKKMQMERTEEKRTRRRKEKRKVAGE
jgi:hypothetical protein